MILQGISRVDGEFMLVLFTHQISKREHNLQIALAMNT